MEKKLKEAEILINNKEFKKAKELLVSMDKEYPDAYEIKKNLGFCCVNLNLNNEAKAYFDKTVELNKEDATSWYYLGILNENLNLLDEAETAYLKVIELRETFSNAYKNLSILYMKKKDLNKLVEFATIR